FPEVGAALSAMAGDAFQGTLAAERAALVTEAGEALDREGRAIPFAVIGMGKLGGGELNLSSDVDVIYVHGTDDGKTAGPLSAHEWMAKLATRLTRAMSQDDQGMGFRVDLDLRPEGKAGP